MVINTPTDATKECVICGENFTPYNKSHKTCSDDHSIQLRRKLSRERARRYYKPRPQRPDYTCEACGRQQPTQKMGAVPRFCPKCRADRADRAHRKRRESAPRRCYKCNVQLPEAERKPGIAVCDDCRVDPRKNRAEYERRRTLRKYGLTSEQYDEMLAKQGERCAICGGDEPGPKGWGIDHCHTTGKVRGLLCLHCNTALGYAKDDAQTLRKMADYIEAHQEVKI